MKKKMFYSVLAQVILLACVLTVIAEMQSENYKIPTSVFSGGVEHLQARPIIKQIPP